MRITNCSELGKTFIANWEGGFRLRAYRCPAGFWTISAGVTIYPDSTRVKEGDMLGSDDEARRLFTAVIRPVEDGVDAVTRDDINQNQFDALTSFAYNLGVEALKTSTLLRLVNAYAEPKDVEAQFKRWIYADLDPTHPGLEQSPGLIRRRNAEATLYTAPTYLKP